MYALWSIYLYIYCVFFWGGGERGGVAYYYASGQCSFTCRWCGERVFTVDSFATTVEGFLTEGLVGKSLFDEVCFCFYCGAGENIIF